MTVRSARREPSTPPTLPGFTFVRLLGMGGFADVFLYEQQMPRRSVAVKVLLAGSLSDDVRRRFRLEADLMARLSHHPSIVTVHHADVAADGRPYLVMEYCSRTALGDRYRTERMGVAEVLRIGVRLASAVESAHRAGVLHRDIKPANVLVTDFGWPALTDFGIAATTAWDSGTAVGMSIPWAPPELLAEEPEGDSRSDVYSLAATIYSLLARRSPFEMADAGNSAADLIARIERSPLPVTGRGDVPDSLHAVLDRAMAKDPARRHASALALARALQQVEAELLLPVTALDLPEDVVATIDEDTRDVTEDRGGPGEGDQATRLRPVASISPDGRAPGTLVADRVAPAVGRDASVAGSAPSSLGPGGVLPHTSDDVLEQWQRSLGDQAVPEPSPEPAGRARRVVAVVSAVLLVALAGVAVVLALRSPVTVVEGGPDPAPTTAPVVAVPSPQDLEGRWLTDDSVVFTWSNPAPQEGDTYLWRQVVTGSATTPEQVDEPTATLTGLTGPTEPNRAGEVCVEVSIVREDRRASTVPTVGCVRDE